MKPSAIIIADIHIRETVPQARIDDYWEAQAHKIAFIANLQLEHNHIPVLDAGDIIHREEDASKRKPPSPWLLTWCIENFPYIITVPGNHDIPSRNLKLLYKSGVRTLEAAGRLHILTDDEEVVGDDFNVRGFPWGTEIKNLNPKTMGRKYVALAHTFVYHKEKPHPDIQASSALSLLKKYTSYDLIVTGHNHQSFAVEHQGRWLVNPGSMMRMYADQGAHKPRVYLWYAETNEVEPVYLPIEKGVISRKHIEVKQEKDERMIALVSRFKSNYETVLSFEKNAEKFFANNRVRRSVEDMVWEAING